MEAVFYCDICGAPMRLLERLPNHKSKGKEYRKRRFGCTFCDYKKLIIAGGEGDERIFPERGIAQVEAIARKESKNREI